MKPLSQFEVADNLRPLGSVTKFQPSGDRDSRQTHTEVPAGEPRQLVRNRGEEAPFEEPAFVWGGLESERLLAEAVDAIHTYLVFRARFDLSVVTIALNRVVQCMEAHATTLGREARAGQDTP